MFDRSYVEKAADSGLTKLTLLQTDPLRYTLRSILAGMYLTITVLTYWTLVHNLHESPFGKVLASLFFGVGLTIIVFTNAELFTSNTMYMTVSTAEGKTGWQQTAILWGVCFLGNLVGALIVAGLLEGAGVIAALPAGHALFDGAAHKVHQSAQAIFFKGILANWVVCLAVRLALRCKEDVAKIMVIIPVVFIFLYLGFEHSIANMGTFAISLLGNGTITLEEAGFNLFFSTLGNIVGGAVLLGLPFAYINPTERD
ncbi:formate/nitrite transporter family protein [Chitinilyticum piscinae]|uniref:Formate/nitrite transporter family protein n=1 Tax=Chitinilyticum piscinae TaxID=2866724 RepID=A0A8J7FQS3_9NEIS|nr:formate/nitrite transporter family protein [Chitinilyticum piscinae]MBE9609021.1 formate/nitrite transporter family protein [Chitinilyticum piscinae]